MLDDEYYSIYSIERGLGIISSRDFPVKHPSVKFRDSIHRHPPVAGVFKALKFSGIS